MLPPPPLGTKIFTDKRSCAWLGSLLRDVVVCVLFFAHAVHHLVAGAHGDAGDRLHVSGHGSAEEHRLPFILSRERETKRDKAEAAAGRV